MVWMRPSGRTDSTMPMWRPSQTMRSPGLRLLGRLASRGRCAAPSPRSRRPRRSPGPARRAARRPAWPPRRRSSCTTGRRRCPRWPCGTRRCAGESLEPGGCSVCPISRLGERDHLRARRRSRSPRPGAAAVVARRGGRLAEHTGEAGRGRRRRGRPSPRRQEVAVAAGAATLGWSIAWISAMRARATSRLTSRVVGTRPADRATSREGGPEGPPVHCWCCVGLLTTGAARGCSAAPGWPEPAWRCRPAAGSGSW